MSSTIEYLTHSRRPIHAHLHGSAFCRTLSVVQALIHEQLLLTCAPRSLSTTMLWEHHLFFIVILFLVDHHMAKKVKKKYR